MSFCSYLTAVSTHSRPKAAGDRRTKLCSSLLQFQHTAARRRLQDIVLRIQIKFVSTHSRPKAAVVRQNQRDLGSLFQHTAARRRLMACFSVEEVIFGFNTQPPEGGWQVGFGRMGHVVRFQHTAARRRLGGVGDPVAQRRRFNTQPPEGGCEYQREGINKPSSFNTQPPEGGWYWRRDVFPNYKVSTHSRPKAAARCALAHDFFRGVSTHSRPKPAEPLLKALLRQVSQPQFR